MSDETAPDVKLDRETLIRELADAMCPDNARTMSREPCDLCQTGAKRGYDRLIALGLLNHLPEEPVALPKTGFKW